MTKITIFRREINDSYIVGDLLAWDNGISREQKCKNIRKKETRQYNGNYLIITYIGLFLSRKNVPLNVSVKFKNKHKLSQKYNVDAQQWMTRDLSMILHSKECSLILL